MQKIIFIDGNALFHRAFHAIPGLKNSKGELTNAIYGFTSMLLGLLSGQKPDYIAITWDRKAKTFRHEQFTEYKGTRPPAPEGLFEQMPPLKNLMTAFKIPMFEMDGYEADDLLATLVTQAEAKKIESYIATGDRDTLQLVNDWTRIIMPEFGFQKYKIYDAAAVLEKYGVRPDQIIDYKSLVGDTSDNVPGVHGIGEKTASELLKKYETLENIYENLEAIGGKVAEKLKNGAESAMMSKKLVTLTKDAPITLDLDACKTHDFDANAIQSQFEHFEFRSLGKRLKELESIYNEKRQEAHNYAIPLLFE
jgi:DNA polymerase-1